MKKGSRVNKVIGERYFTKNNRWFEVIGYSDKNSRDRIIKFDSGYIRRTTTRDVYNGTDLIDIFSEKRIYGIAINDIEDGSKHHLYFRWVNMIGRCYNTKHSQYKSYGAKGCFVEDYLLRFSNYIKFISSLDNYDNLLKYPKEYQIDKDIKCKHIYGYTRETITIVKFIDNINEENKGRKIPISQYDLNHNHIRDYVSITEASKETNIHRGNIARNVRGKSHTAGGYIWKLKIN